jgi:hypothetical protein
MGRDHGGALRIGKAEARRECGGKNGQAPKLTDRGRQSHARGGKDVLGFVLHFILFRSRDLLLPASCCCHCMDEAGEGVQQNFVRSEAATHSRLGRSLSLEATAPSSSRPPPSQLRRACLATAGRERAPSLLVVVVLALSSKLPVVPPSFLS